MRLFYVKIGNKRNIYINKNLQKYSGKILKKIKKILKKLYEKELRFFKKNLCVF